MTFYDAVKLWLAKEAVGLGIFLLILLIMALWLGGYWLYLTYDDWRRKRGRAPPRVGRTRE